MRGINHCRLILSEIKFMPKCVIKLLVMAGACFILSFSDSTFAAYLCITLCALICTCENSQQATSRYQQWETWPWSVTLTTMICAANYTLWEDGSKISIVICFILIVGVFLAWSNILSWITWNLQILIWKPSNDYWKPSTVFATTFFLIAVINCLVLFLCKYPGNLTPDSINQIQEILTGKYNNHHPFYHTMTIKVFVDLGTLLFHDISAGVALYSCFSIIFMAAIFAFSVETIAQLHGQKKIVIALIVFFATMPYHILNSMTMWKDVFFGAFVLLFIVLLFRIMENVGLRLLNYIGLFISGIGICLYRSNGFIVFIFTVFIFILLCKFSYKKIVFIMLACITVGFLLKHPLLNLLKVEQPDLVESLSIPVQQIARDVIENDDFTKAQWEVLNEVIDTEKIPGAYASHISDPIKALIREKNNQIYIKEHVKEYVLLYLTRIKNHPLTYIKAWIDQTKGYWNGGYNYWYLAQSIEPNNMGIERITHIKALNFCVLAYGWIYKNCFPFQIFVSIGFFDWLVFICLFIAIRRKDRLGIIATTPLIMNVVTLLIATPVFSELRYNYCVFCALPVVMVFVLRPGLRTAV